MHKLKSIIWAAVLIVSCFFISFRNAVISKEKNIVASASINTLDSAAILDSINAESAANCTPYMEKAKATLEMVTPETEVYFPAIEESMQEHGLPIELKYLAIVESNLNPSAKSKAGAVGMWQLMPATARMLGLVITHKYDERKLSDKSTDAAAKYLKQLYDKFGDWTLAIAAYNAGAGNVNKAIRKAGSNNFWELQNFLPLETREYVKKFIAFHYYFEQKGSEVTMTKAEWTAYEQKISETSASVG